MGGSIHEDEICCMRSQPFTRPQQPRQWVPAAEQSAIFDNGIERRNEPVKCKVFAPHPGEWTKHEYVKLAGVGDEDEVVCGGAHVAPNERRVRQEQAQSAAKPCPCTTQRTLVADISPDVLVDFD